MNTSIAREQVAQSFSRAARSYDAAAELQREVGEQLWQMCAAASCARVIDVGCGTGFMTRKLCTLAQQVLAVDIATGMLQAVQEQQWPSVATVQADMARLPFDTQCADLLLSSLALQWASNLPATLQEWRRVLRPGGSLAFATFLPGTLAELQASWQCVDNAVHVNDFVAQDTLASALTTAGFMAQYFVSQQHVRHYPDVTSLARELKAIGAHNMNSGRLTGLAGRQRWQAMQHAYEQHRGHAGLPATYQVLYVVAR